MPPDADIIQQGDKAHAKYIERGMQSEYDGEDQQGCPLCGGIGKTGDCGNGGEPGMKQRVNGDSCTIVNARSDSELTNQVKPAGEPSPTRSAKLRSPVIQAASRRKCRSQFSHAQRNDHDKDSDQRPADRGRRISGSSRDQVKECNTPTKDRDDGERDSEVGEATHGTEEFLCVAQGMQAFHITGDKFFFGWTLR